MLQKFLSVLKKLSLCTWRYKCEKEDATHLVARQFKVHVLLNTHLCNVPKAKKSFCCIDCY